MATTKKSAAKAVTPKGGKPAGTSTAKAAPGKTALSAAATPPAKAGAKAVNKSASKPAARAAAPKPATKTAPASAAKGAATAQSMTANAAKSAKPAKPAKTEKTPKAKKPKQVRDSFTMPKAEYAVLDTLKLRGAQLGNPVKKSELLRAGVMALAAMSDTALLASLKAVPAIKTGRPAVNAASNG